MKIFKFEIVQIQNLFIFKIVWIQKNQIQNLFKTQIFDFKFIQNWNISIVQI
jgi:hypothetical protein